MSVLIRGMEMPTNCIECRLTYDSSWCLLLDEPNECVDGGLMWKRCAETGRLEDCPLDPVQPHGRLIDADVLCERLMTAWHTADSEGRRIIGEVIADVVTPIVVGTPTIIGEEAKA